MSYFLLPPKFILKYISLDIEATVIRYWGKLYISFCYGKECYSFQRWDMKYTVLILSQAYLVR